MATSGGDLLVPKTLRLIRFALKKTSRLFRDKLPQATRVVEAEVQPIYARNTVQHQAISRIAAIRQSQSRWYSTQQAVKTSLRQFSSSTRSAGGHDGAALPASRTAQAVGRLSSRAPFASSLRPNLTGGTLCRSAGGYGTGAGRISGARYFSHGPAAPIQVVNNVSQAVRAFWLSGQKAQFDGMSQRNEKQFKSVSAIQEKTQRNLRSVSYTAPGSYVDFKVAPTITALGPLSNMPTTASIEEPVSLNNSTVMNTLSVDFARALKDLAIVMNDLQKLSSLGHLPLSLPNSSTLRVAFPGCDADTVSRLCEEFDIRRGLIYQDEDFDLSNGTEMALLFPYAPSHIPCDMSFSSNVDSSPAARDDPVQWQDMLSAQPHSSPKFSNQSMTSHDFEEVAVETEVVDDNPWLSSPSGYSSLNESDEDDAADYFSYATQANIVNPHGYEATGYEGLEGIYRFLEECDRERR